MKKVFLPLIVCAITLGCRQSGNTSGNVDSLNIQDTVTHALPQGGGATTLKLFDAKLSTLPSAVSSSGDALKIFENEFNKSNPSSCDSAFDHFVKFQGSLISGLQEQFETRADYETMASGVDESKLSKETKDYIEQLKANAILVAEEEGMTFLDTDPEAVRDHFHQYLSPSGKLYIDQWKKELEQPFAIDAGLTISVNDLVDRLAFWDDYLVKHPETIFKSEAQSKINSYRYFLLIGMDNTPAFDYDQGTVSEEFLNAYKKFSTEYPPSKNRDIIAEYLTVLEASDFKKSPEVEKFIEGSSNF